MKDWILGRRLMEEQPDNGGEGGGGGTGKARAQHDDVQLALVGRVDQLLRGFIIGPFFSERTSGYFRVKFHSLSFF